MKLDYLKRFYFGNGRAGLKDLLATSTGQIDARTASSIQIPAAVPGAEGIVVRVGRYGPFIEQEGRRASLPPEDKLAPDELTSEKCVELLAHSARAEEPLGTCPKTGLPVFAKNGRFGPYVQLGVTGDGRQRLATGQPHAEGVMETPRRRPRPWPARPERGRGQRCTCQVRG